MYWTLTILSLAFLWLAHRLYVLAKVPVTDLIKTLNIDIPKSSKISVDNITSDKVYIHWDLPLAEYKISSFVLYINGKQASTINGHESHCCLSNLLANTKYKIDLISINSKGYKAKSESVFIKTKSDKLQNYPNNILLENPENLFKLLTNNPDVSTVQKLSTPSATTANGEARATGRSRSNTVNSINGGVSGPNGTTSYAASTTTNSSFLPDPKSMGDIEELRYYLESGQEELHTVLNQQSQAIRDFKEQESILLEERDKLRDRKKLEDGNRQSMKSEIKMLDDSRRLTELKKTKQENGLISKKKVIQKMESDLTNWNIKIEEFEKQKSDINDSEDRVHREIDIDITKKREKIKELQVEISKIDEDIKAINAKKRQREQLKPQFVKIFKSLGDHTDSAGCIDGEGVKNLELLKTLDSEIHSKTHKEIELDTRLEAEWRAQQQREVNNCLKVSKAFELIKLENTSLKNSLDPTRSHSSTPPSDHSQPSNLAQVGIQQLAQQQIFAHSQAQSQSVTPQGLQQTPQGSVPQNNGFPFSNQNFNYNSMTTGSSPSLNSYQLHQESTPPAFTSSSLWNSFTPTNNYSGATNDGTGFSFNATVPVTSHDNSQELEDTNDGLVNETNAKHLLPQYLIDEDTDYIKLLNSVQAETSRENHLSNGNNAFGMNNAFANAANDSSANLSTKSIFHNEFGIPSQPRFSLDNPSSPPQSYNADVLSDHVSPSNTSNDIHSVFSGNQNDIYGNSFQPTQPHQNSKENGHLSSFSPRRLSNVFNFGKKNDDHHEPPATAPSLTSTNSQPQSKFFNKNIGSSKFLNNNNPDSIDSNNGGTSHQNNPSFTFTQDLPSPNQLGGSSRYLLDSVWKSPGMTSSPAGSHNRNVSQNSTHSNNTADQSFAKYFPTSSVNDNNHLNTNYLNVSKTEGGSNVSLSSEAMSDSANLEIGGPIQLSSTNKSSNTTSIKSLKSSADSSNISSSPSFFRKNKFLINPFSGSSSQGSDSATGKSSSSPSKQSANLFVNTSSPSKIDAHTEDSDVEEYNPTPTSTTPKRLFSRNRKTSSTNIRKQSMSSGHNNDTDSNMTDSSIQSATSTSNGKSLVKKFFGKNNKDSHKDNIDDIDEKAEESENGK